MKVEAAIRASSIVALSVLLLLLGVIQQCRASTVSMDSSALSATRVLDIDQLKHIDAHTDEALDFMWSLHTSSSRWTSILGSSTSDAMKSTSIRSSLRALERKHIEVPPTYLSDGDKQSSHRHECVKGVGVIDAAPIHVFKLLQHNDQVLALNENLDSIRDVFVFPKKSFADYEVVTKVSWSKATPKTSAIPFIKTREFYTIVSFFDFYNGTYAIINRPAYVHALSPSSVVRGSMLLSCNIFESFGGNQTLITQLLQINPGGTADTPAIAWILNRQHLTSYVFIRKLAQFVEGRKAESILASLKSALSAFTAQAQRLSKWK